MGRTHVKVRVAPTRVAPAKGGKLGVERNQYQEFLQRQEFLHIYLEQVHVQGIQIQVREFLAGRSSEKIIFLKKCQGNFFPLCIIFRKWKWVPDINSYKWICSMLFPARISGTCIWIPCTCTCSKWICKNSYPCKNSWYWFCSTPTASHLQKAQLRHNRQKLYHSSIYSITLDEVHKASKDQAKQLKMTDLSSWQMPLYMYMSLYM